MYRRELQHITTLHHTIPYHTKVPYLLDHTVLYFTILCLALPCCIESYRIVLYCIVSYRIVLCHAMFVLCVPVLALSWTDGIAQGATPHLWDK